MQKHASLHVNLVIPYDNIPVVHIVKLNIFLQMQQGRRTQSLKASYDILSRGNPDLTKDFTFPSGSGYRAPGGAVASTSAAAATPEPPPKSSRNKK